MSHRVGDGTVPFVKDVLILRVTFPFVGGQNATWTMRFDTWDLAGLVEFNQGHNQQVFQTEAGGAFRMSIKEPASLRFRLRAHSRPLVRGQIEYLQRLMQGPHMAEVEFTNITWPFSGAPLPSNNAGSLGDWQRVTTAFSCVLEVENRPLEQSVRGGYGTEQEVQIVAREASNGYAYAIGGEGIGWMQINSTFVVNAQPSAQAPGVGAQVSGIQGNTYTLEVSAAASEQGNDLASITVFWGDGTSTVLPITGAMDEVQIAGHTYSAEGVYGVTVVAEDVEGGQASVTSDILVLGGGPEIS